MTYPSYDIFAKSWRPVNISSETLYYISQFENSLYKKYLSHIFLNTQKLII